MTLQDLKSGGMLPTAIKKISLLEEWMRSHKALYHPSKDSVAINGGWNEVYDTWTRASNNTITVPSGAADIYKKGMGIRWKQGGSFKYGSITVVADTLLTFTGGTDYVVSAGTAITDVAWTLTPETAIGFPAYFNCAAPTWDTTTIDNGTGGVQPTAGSAYFTVGSKIKLFISLGSASVLKNNTGFNIIISAIPATLPNIVSPIAGVLGYGFFATVNYPASAYQISGTSLGLLSSTSILNNASIAYTSMRLEYEY